MKDEIFYVMCDGEVITDEIYETLEDALKRMTDLQVAFPDRIYEVVEFDVS